MNVTRDVCLGTVVLGCMLIGLHSDAELALWPLVKLGLKGVLWALMCLVVFRLFGSEKI